MRKGLRSKCGLSESRCMPSPVLPILFGPEFEPRGTDLLRLIHVSVTVRAINFASITHDRSCNRPYLHDIFILHDLEHATWCATICLIWPAPGETAAASGMEPSFTPVEFSFPLPRLPHLNLHGHVSLMGRCIMVHLTTTDVGAPPGASPPLGSFVYAMPDVRKSLSRRSDLVGLGWSLTNVALFS
jgi:hypothetical protein